MFGYIYRTHNKVNGKMYIGKRMSDKFLHENYLGSGYYLHNAIKKYGSKNFYVELLEEVEGDKKTLSEREKYWISYYNAVSSNNYYNIASGGDGGNLVDGLTQEDYKKYRSKCNQDKKGKIKVNDGIKDKFIKPEELEYYISLGYKKGSCRNISGKNNPMYGVHLSGERHWAYGRKGKDSPNYGKKYERHMELDKDKYRMCKGRIYITDGEHNKMVYRDELEKYISNGWRRGQTKKNKNVWNKGKKKYVIDGKIVYL